MITTTLPTLKRNLVDGKIEIIKSEIKVKIQTSIFAEEKWEKFFPKNNENETLFTYIERIKNQNLIGNNAYILSNLKALFCFVESDDLPDFKSFCELFDLVDADYLSLLIEKIKYIFDLALNTSVVTKKN